MLADVQCPYLHGPITRQDAEGYLYRFGFERGHFLVRRKDGDRFTMVLSVCTSSRVEHHKIYLPNYSIGPFAGPYTCLYELIQAMRLPT